MRIWQFLIAVVQGSGRTRAIDLSIEPIRLFCSSVCCWSQTHPTWVSQSSVSMVQGRMTRGSACTGGFVRDNFKSSTDIFSFVVNSGKIFSWSFCSFLFDGTEICEEFCTNLWKTLHSSGKDIISDCVAWYCNSLITFVVASAISSHPGSNKWTTWVIVFAKEEHLFNLSVTPALCSSVRIRRRCVRCSWTVSKRENVLYIYEGRLLLYWQ